MSNKYLFESEFVVGEQHANNKGYIKFSELQKAFVEVSAFQCKQYGVDIDSLQKKGLTWVISKIRIKINKLPKVGDCLKILTWPVDSGKLVFDRDYKVLLCGKTIIKASSRWCIIDTKTRRPVKKEIIGAFFENNIKKTIIADPFSNIFEKLDDYKLGKHVVTDDEIDINNHVNNAIYYDFAFKTFVELNDLTDKIKEIFIHYHKEAVLNEEIVLKFGVVDNTYYVFGNKSIEKNDVIFEFNAII